MRKHIFLKGLLKQPALLTWLLEARASHRAAVGLAPAAVPQPPPDGQLEGAGVLRAGTAAEQRRAWLEEAVASAPLLMSPTNRKHRMALQRRLSLLQSIVRKAWHVLLSGGGSKCALRALVSKHATNGSLIRRAMLRSGVACPFALAHSHLQASVAPRTSHRCCSVDEGLDIRC